MQKTDNNIQLSEDKIELLKHIEQIQRDDLKYHRDFQNKIFIWSSNILLIVIVALLITKQTQNVIWDTYGYAGRSIASLAILTISVFSIQWQNRHRIWHQENRQVISTIDKLLHCYEKGYFDPIGKTTLFPARWNDSSKNDKINVY